MTQLDSLPVIIGAGQDSRLVPDDLDAAFSPADMAGQALSQAFKDAGLGPRDVDVCYGIRLFADSGPVFPNPFGGSNNFPASACARAGSGAKHFIYDHVGGEMPQRTVADAAQKLMDGEIESAAIVGAEAAANIRAATRAGANPRWIESRMEPLDDRGPIPMSNDGSAGFGGFMIHKQAISHRIAMPVLYYALMESARRAALGLSKPDYLKQVSKLWQQFASVAAKNPYAFVRQDVTGEDIVRPGPKNPVVTSPYTKAMVARDGVNLGAAVLMTTYGKAKEWGVKDVTFLQGHDHAAEPPILTRKRLDRAGSQRRVLESTGRDADYYDLYSCFPIVPLESRRILGLTGQEGTLTGGLPFFGGPGNNYSLHAIAEAHARVRGSGEVAVVHANGGMSTKHAVGRYSGLPPKDIAIRKSPDSEAVVTVEEAENPEGKIAAYTVEHRKGEPSGVLMIAETTAGSRFYARAGIEHALTFLENDPMGVVIRTETRAGQNMITGI